MTYAIAKTKSNNDTRLWMTIAFIAGLVLAALCWLTFSTGTITGHKYMLPQNPSVTPEKLYPADLPNYRLVHACPGREALL
jgi:hypothetical protein